ncbi:hypothetical protein C1646_761120 [Rhizophagus diaphanus]|nr:hypothetical protein C1646_761120 [Rhizophagus diaphanus] [Rhizophagus sp. MUCL 43196]
MSSDLHDSHSYDISQNCILGTDKQQSLYLFFDQNQNTEETESYECLPCIGLFGDSYTNYAISTPSGYGGGERIEFNTTLQATFLWKIDQFEEEVIRSVKCTVMTTNLLGLYGECIDLKKNSRLKDALKSTKEEAGISMKGLRYSEHLTHFFSLLSESSREYEVFRKAFGEMSIQKIHQICASNTELITDPNLVLDNMIKFACIAKELKWEGPILLMSDYTKIRSKLVYSQELGYITRSILPSSEVSVSDINDIHKKICNIYENDALVTQVWVIVLKIPIGKITPMVIAILPTKGNESAEQIFNILCTVLDFAHKNNLNILSMGANGARSEFNAQTKIMNSSSTYFTFDDLFYNVHFKVPIINGRPLVCVQDLKHAKKTA